MEQESRNRLSEASLRPTHSRVRRTQPSPERTTMVAQDAPKQQRPWPIRLWNAFKDIAILFSFAVNFILVAVIVILVLNADVLFDLKNRLAEPWLADLDHAFAALGATTINSTVHIDDSIPVVFDLALEQNTNVILTAPVPLSVPAQFVLPGGGGAINGTVSLNLPQGQALPIELGMSVPVSTTVPVVMQVPVRMELSECGMAPAVEQLRAVFRPIAGFVQGLPNSTEELLRPNE
jgi:hypothetical protein